MPELITDLDAERIASRLAAVRERAGPAVEVLIATKYVPAESMGTLAEAGIKLVGENRLQDLEEKRERWGDSFRWDFIGTIQSRKLPRIAAAASRIHSVASDSALLRLGAIAADPDGAPPEILLQVNVSGEVSKGGFEPERLAEAVADCPFEVVGLSTMPPLADRPEDSRPYFTRLAELAREHGLAQLSMGTSQDWEAAVEEGATIIRLGSTVLR